MFVFVFVCSARCDAWLNDEAKMLVSIVSVCFVVFCLFVCLFGLFVSLCVCLHNVASWFGTNQLCLGY